MPKHRKGKGKATAPMAVPSTPEPTPAVKTGNRQVSVERKLAAEVSVSEPLARAPTPDGIRSSDGYQ